jgi:alpha-1,6-mannosyltransferase
MSLRVVDVTEFYSLRGGGVRSYLSAKNHILCQAGHLATVVAPGPPQRSTDSTVFVGGPPVPYDPTYHLLWRLDKIRVEVERRNPDVVEIHSPYLAALGVLRLRQGFRVRTCFWHSDFADTYGEILLARAPRRVLQAATAPAWSWVRAIGERVDATIVASRVQRNKLAAHGVPRVELVPMGVERSVFRPEARDEALRRALLGDAKILAVGVGRFAVEKRWPVVLEAVRRLAARKVPLTLALFGDGPERVRLEKEARDLPVRFYGFERDRAKLARAIASADVLLHACPYETFGIGVAEALACGTPVVVPAAGGAGEHATTFPDAAEAYPAGDAQACAEAALRVLSRSAEARAAAGRTAAARVPSVEDHFRALVELYGSLLERAGARSARSVR